MGIVVLVVVVVMSVVGFRSLGDYDWIEAVWMTVVTISSVGFSEQPSSPPQVLLFTVGVIVVGMSAVAYAFGGFVQMVLEGEIQSALGHRRMTMGIERQHGHVVICGFGRTGAVLAGELARAGQPFVVVEQSEDEFEEAKEHGYLSLLGDATDEELLAHAGIERASALVSALPSDADNVFLTLTARNMNSEIQIISRAEHSSTEKKLVQAGANKVVMPAIIGAHRIGRLITRPSTAHLVEIVTESSLDLELDELTLPDDSKLIGVSVAETEAHRTHRLLVVAIKQAGGEMVFNPDASYQFQASDVAIVIGSADDIGRFRAEFDLKLQ